MISLATHGSPYPLNFLYSIPRLIYSSLYRLRGSLFVLHVAFAFSLRHKLSRQSLVASTSPPFPQLRANAIALFRSNGRFIRLQSTTVTGARPKNTQNCSAFPATAPSLASPLNEFCSIQYISHPPLRPLLTFLPHRENRGACAVSQAFSSPLRCQQQSRRGKEGGGRGERENVSTENRPISKITRLGGVINIYENCTGQRSCHNWWNSSAGIGSEFVS